MLKATLRGLLAHKLRLALTALAVVLGVAFVSGTYVLTDTLKRTFDVLFSEVTAGVDVSVRSASGFGADAGADVDREPLAESLLDDIRAVDGVQSAEGGVGGLAQLLDKDGEAITTAGAPTLGFSWTTATALTPLRLRSGHEPLRDGEVVIDAATAKKHKLAIGDRIGVITTAGREPFTIVGITGFGEQDNLAGATLAAFDTRTAQRVFAKVGTYDTIDIEAADTVSARELLARVSAVLPPGIEAVTGSQVTQENVDSVGEFIGFFGTFLRVFAGIALFVGTFIILNTFSILVSQRTRELALLRALGASRRQVLASVVGEAGLVGLASSIVGLGLGVLFAIGLQALMRAFGLDLPSGSSRILPRTVIVSLVVGALVTMVASLAPALRASRLAPVTALTGAGAEQVGSLRVRAVAGGITGTLGASAALYGLFGDGDILGVGLGVGLVFIAVALLTPLVARPVARAIGRPLLWRGRVSGRLGRENAMRNPRRTAATASALTIGLGLVGCMTVLAGSITESAGAVIDRSLSADYIATTDSFEAAISPALAEGLAAQPELAAVTSIQAGEFELRGSRQSLAAGDPATIDELMNVRMIAGGIDALVRGELLVEERQARDMKLAVGQTVPVTFSRTGDGELTVGGIYARNDLLGGYLVSTSVFGANFTDPLDLLVLAKGRDGLEPDQTRAAVRRVADDYPNVTVRDQAEFKAEQRRQVNQLLGLVSALLGLAVIIAFLGIINTLALSVFERTRELGLLRAVGMARRQVKAMVRAESVIIAVMGAVIGLAVGVLFGWVLVSALSDEGITELVVPVGTLLVYVVLAGILGVFAAVLPARRAARLDVLAAISHD